MLIASIAWSKVIHVPGDQPTIQAGIDAAQHGDMVLVANGTYTGSGNQNLDFKGKAITLTSENGAENCIIACEYSDDCRGFYFHSGETSESVVSGFTIKEGKLWGGYGAGIYCNSSSPTITNNIITCNRVNTGWEGGGGGICCNSSSPTITNNTITANSADYGGGIYCSSSSSPIITNNTITANSAVGTLSPGNGGGIYCTSSSPTITNCIITDNEARSHDYYVHGGGIYCTSSSPTITNCTITDNKAETIEISHGGGIYCTSSSPTITNCIITGNEALGESNAYGGGIYCTSYSTITNCTITGNRAYRPRHDLGGVGGGIYCDTSSSTVLNTILWNDNPDEIDGSITVTYSDVKGGWPGEGNIDADPLFVDPSSDNYHLQASSPCIDAGTYSGAPPDDLDGNPRDEFPDMGAYEYQGDGTGSLEWVKYRAIPFSMLEEVGHGMITTLLRPLSFLMARSIACGIRAMMG